MNLKFKQVNKTKNCLDTKTMLLFFIIKKVCSTYRFNLTFPLPNWKVAASFQRLSLVLHNQPNIRVDDDPFLSYVNPMPEIVLKLPQHWINILYPWTKTLQPSISRMWSRFCRTFFHRLTEEPQPSRRYHIFSERNRHADGLYNI